MTMYQYGVTDREFSDIVDSIREGELIEARELLDGLVNDYACEAVEDFRQDFEAEEEHSDLSQAKEELRRGALREGLIWMERFLGSDFIGVLAR